MSRYASSWNRSPGLNMEPDRTKYVPYPGQGVGVSGVGVDGLEFATGLLDHGGVSVLPGIAFGENTSQFVRLSLTHPVHIMSKAFDRIERFVSRDK